MGPKAFWGAPPEFHFLMPHLTSPQKLVCLGYRNGIASRCLVNILPDFLTVTERSVENTKYQARAEQTLLLLLLRPFFDSTSLVSYLRINRVILEPHWTSNVIVDPGREHEATVGVNAQIFGRQFERGNSEVFGLVHKDVGKPDGLDWIPIIKVDLVITCITFR